MRKLIEAVVGSVYSRLRIERTSDYRQGWVLRWREERAINIPVGGKCRMFISELLDAVF